jgi:hypothetical protein
MTTIEIPTTIKEYGDERVVRIFLNHEYGRIHRAGCHHASEFIVPRVIVALNEGGYNETWVCLDCVLEWVAQHRGELGYSESDGAGMTANQYAIQLEEEGLCSLTEIAYQRSTTCGRLDTYQIRLHPKYKGGDDQRWIILNLDGERPRIVGGCSDGFASWEEAKRIADILEMEMCELLLRIKKDKAG